MEAKIAVRTEQLNIPIVIRVVEALVMDIVLIRIAVDCPDVVRSVGEICRGEIQEVRDTHL